MMALLLAAQLTVIVQMEQHTLIEAQGDVVVTNQTVDYVFSAPQSLGQLQDALRGLSAESSAQTVSNQIAKQVRQMLSWIKKTDEIFVVMP